MGDVLTPFNCSEVQKYKPHNNRYLSRPNFASSFISFRRTKKALATDAEGGRLTPAESGFGNCSCTLLINRRNLTLALTRFNLHSEIHLRWQALSKDIITTFSSPTVRKTTIMMGGLGSLKIT